MGYIKDRELFQSEKPYQYTGPDTRVLARNFENPLMEIQLTDMRTVPDFKPTLDSHGFCFVEHKSKELPTLADESNSQPYSDEMAGLAAGTGALSQRQAVWGVCSYGDE